MITDYFTEFERTIHSSSFVVSSDIEKRKVNDFFGIIEGIIVFEKGKLDVLEVVRELNGNFNKKKYKYHFRNLDNEMVFRYDNMPHHKHLDNFPHHKHLPTGLLSSQQPSFEKVMFEIELFLEE